VKPQRAQSGSVRESPKMPSALVPRKPVMTLIWLPARVRTMDIAGFVGPGEPAHQRPFLGGTGRRWLLVSGLRATVAHSGPGPLEGAGD
jgi:hypothetical protein